MTAGPKTSDILTATNNISCHKVNISLSQILTDKKSQASKAIAFLDKAWTGISVSVSKCCVFVRLHISIYVYILVYKY